MKWLILIIIVVSAVLGCTARQLRPALLLTCHIKLASDNKREIQTEITNVTNKWLVLLKWNTPFDDHYPRNDVFVICGPNGKKLPYCGRYISLLGYADSDYLLLKPHESFAILRSLEDGYHFPSHGPFLVRYRAVITCGLFNSDAEAQQAIARAVRSSEPGRISQIVTVESNQLLLP